MKRAQAHQEAHRRWGTSGTAPGDRYGSVIVRQKKVVDRFEVGYAIRGGRMDTGMVLHQWVLMGSGPSWEEAFARADGCARAREPLIVRVPTLLSVVNNQLRQDSTAPITDDQIREIIAATFMLGKGKRLNAHTRSLRRDCQAALEGSRACREHIAEMIAAHGGHKYHGVSMPKVPR
jgi:hypothetical protein